MSLNEKEFIYLWLHPHPASLDKCTHQGISDVLLKPLKQLFVTVFSFRAHHFYDIPLIMFDKKNHTL